MCLCMRAAGGALHPVVFGGHGVNDVADLDVGLRPQRLFSGPETGQRQRVTRNADGKLTLFE